MSVISGYTLEGNFTTTSMDSASGLGITAAGDGMDLSPHSSPKNVSSS
jgi:hypothetical protein